MKKIGFVAPWYGENIPGGAEMELRGVATHLQAAGYEVEVLTTCVEQFTADWNKDFYKPGTYDVAGIPVRRFKVRKRNTKVFDAINFKFMNGIPVSTDEEDAFLKEMVNSLDLYEYIEQHSDEYACFIHIPYMFGTAYYGMKACPEKSVMIPCFHDEPYLYINRYKELFSQIRGMVYLAHPEYELANRTFDLSNVTQRVIGAGVDSGFTYDADRFRKKFGIEQDFILYAGRKDPGKNVDMLVNYFADYKNRHRDSDLKLVLIGGGKIEVPDFVKADVIDLGFVDKQDKYDAYAAATVLCQPSTHESFSIVIMESWLCERPVLVHWECEVTKHFVRECNSGLYFNNYFEFEGCIDYFLEHRDVADAMGKTGKEFVLQNFTWDVIVEKYKEFFNELNAG